MDRLNKFLNNTYTILSGKSKLSFIDVPLKGEGVSIRINKDDNILDLYHKCDGLLNLNSNYTLFLVFDIGNMVELKKTSDSIANIGIDIEKLQFLMMKKDI